MPSSAQRLLTRIAAVLLVLLTTSAVRAQERWVKRAPFPEPSQEIAGAAANGKLYIFGGLRAEPNSTPKGLVWEYDAAADKWTKKKPMPLPAHHLAVAEYQGKIYLFGGAAQRVPGGGNWFPINNAWEYDPATDSWKALAPMPTARGAAVAAAVGDKIYVIGGASVHPGAKLVSLGPNPILPHRALPTNEAYDPATNTWETRSPMPTARNHAAIGVVNGKIYVLGGRIGSVFVGASPTDVVEEYDPATDMWGFAKARMPMPRTGTAYGTYEGKIYVAGGEYLDNDVVGTYRDLDAFDPVTDTWTSLPPLSIPRHGLVGAVIGDHFYVVSGHMQSAAVFGDAMDSDANDAFELPEN
jgi:N-acetylneuraminic acid mutarotase